MDPIYLRFFYNEEEYARAAVLYQVKRGGIIRTNVLYFVVSVVFFLAFGYYKGLFDDSFGILATIGLILLTAAGFGSMFFTLPRRWKQAFRADRSNRMPFTWDIDEQGVSLTHDATQAHFDWGYFREVLETEEFFFLVGVRNKNQLFVAPKRAFESAQQMERFREMAGKFIPIQRAG